MIEGAIFDVAVDIRRGSPNFGQWVGVELSAENKKQLWVPPDFAHGFLVTSDSAQVLYKATDFYSPVHERSIIWNDADIAINWPDIGAMPSLSLKDAEAPSLTWQRPLIFGHENSSIGCQWSSWKSIRYATRPIFSLRAGVKITLANRSNVDLTDLKALRRFLTRHEPEWIINASAYTAVDKAETEPYAAHAVNELAVQALQSIALAAMHA